MASFISEDNIEQALLQRLQHIHGFNVLDCYTPKPEDLNDGSHRAVKAAIEEVLDKDLPDSYDRVAFKEKCDNVFELIVEFAANGRKWVA
ncbi:hypothetical protein [Marinobacter sp. ATCH36]|uniref:hypothetical protein n=1 Tax=Marinobacter sp. ATCH36 TaxID=2945106 RepID=UPI002021EE96|nr:hypothetical protein [Marinobacter sp. ATCH36]MCL7942567.1 hypothetical protein [Marinobacter sp. ATCH36]